MKNKQGKVSKVFSVMLVLYQTFIKNTTNYSRRHLSQTAVTHHLPLTSMVNVMKPKTCRNCHKKQRTRGAQRIQLHLN